MEKKKTDFNDIIDELNWCAFVMSDGNLEAASEFVRERNKSRAKSKRVDKEK